MLSDVLLRGGTTPHLSRRRLAAATAAAVTLVSGAGCSQPSKAPEPLVIGVDLATAGPAAETDQIYRQALELRLAQLNDQRATSERRPVELQFSDNRSDPETTRDNVAGWAADPRVSAVITGSCVECIVDTTEDTDQLEIPIVALAAGDRIATPVEQRRWWFQLAPDAAGVADVLARRITAEGAGTVGVLAGEDRHGRDGARELAGALTAQQAELVAHETVPTSGDVTDRVARAAAAVLDRPAPPPTFEQPSPAPPGPPDALVLWAPPTVALQAADAVRQAGFDGSLWLAPVAAGELTATGSEAEALAGSRLLAADTLVADEVLATMPHRAQRRLWFQSYVSATGGYHAAAGYAADALDVLVAAADRSDDRAGLRGLVETTQHLGLSGQVAFSPGNHTSPDPGSLSLLTFTNDRWHPAT